VKTYDEAAVLQREIGSRMAQRLDYVKLVPATILDAGCGTGEAVGELALRYPGAQVLAFDIALPMVEAARRRARTQRSLLRRLLRPLATARAAAAPLFACADINALPLPGVSADLVWSNLALQWVNDLPRAFAEFRRVLKVGGLLSFTTFGPDTLRELRSAFAGVDAGTHTNRFVDMHDIGDMLVHAGFADPVMDMERLTLTFDSPHALLAELKAIGATNRTRGRPRGLMGRARFARVTRALEALSINGRVPATFEVVYGHAWKGEPRETPEGHAIVRLPRSVRRP
jgi:malonyl-CoA O-methyltransferase